ncbi:RNaseH domain-containing protein [Nostoc sp. NOS(2021)]|uniref:RNaseH domain-containing protein n=1 Tax=Nostoc sp. NOS(2021) TaxID=2815407 RepID=UPI0025F269EE|nr:RNaseH domain-containing protein [Nostoc sp. NOS(2021)]
MPKKDVQPPILLPARMNLAEDALTDFEIAVLEFPFAEIVADFCNSMEEVLSPNRKKKVWIPYRQLNNGLLACASTLTHGFEYFDTGDYRALAVGTVENPLRVPTPEQIHELVIIWVQEWTKQFDGKGKADQVNSVCDRFLENMAIIPTNWNWQPITPKTLIQNINAQKRLGYQAIPSLLATLLHGKKCVIRSGQREQEIQWRKVQGDGSGRTGLFLVSQAFPALYTDDYGKEREGYFVYRLDFRVQTQAGRFNQNGKLKPWIFLHLSCQRYAHEPLIETNYGRDISLLMGMNEERLSGYEVDSTLIRLTIDNNGREDSNMWKFQLPNLLAAFKARPLETTDNILCNPTKYGNLNNHSNWNKDEYYLVHAEGYKYEHESHKRGHSIKPGFSLQERGNIVAQVLELLNGVLISDNPMQSDIPAPSGQKTPLAMRDYEYISQPPSFTKQQKEKLTEKQIKQRVDNRRQQRQTIIADAIERALQGKPIHIFLLWRERDTFDITYQTLRDAFLLDEGEDFPEHVKISPVWINDPNLLKPLDTGGLAPKDGQEFDKQIRNQHQMKLDAWRNFLKHEVIALIDSTTKPYCFAIVEIGQTKKKGVHPKQSIYRVVREACVLEKIGSQMVQTVQPKPFDKENQGTDTSPSYSKKTEGRILNAVLDVTLRQVGALYGLPSEVYEQAGIPKEIAQNLDVIALCRRKTTQGQDNIHYALAVRLRANGAVDVLFPDRNNWIPYAQAGIELGQIFSRVRRDRNYLKTVQLKGIELAKFAADVLTQVGDCPTLVLIEADVWRNERGEENGGQAWFQLKNENLLAKRDILDFQHVPGHACVYPRDHNQLKNLLGIVRFRTGDETTQYITNRQAWNENSPARDLIHLSGFYDTSVPELLHYFSIGRLPKTQKAQDTSTARELYMLDSQDDEYGVNIAFKHQQMLEILPFFVHPDFQKTEESLKSLCRVPHYLRFSPAWSMGNIHSPYPMHLGKQLIKDHLCILGVEV